MISSRSWHVRADAAAVADSRSTKEASWLQRELRRCISWMVIVSCVSLMKTRPCRHYTGNSWRSRYPRWRNSCCIPITHPGGCQTKNDPARIDDKTITKVPGEHVGHLFGRGSDRVIDMAILQEPYHRFIRERRKIDGTALDTGADRS